MKLLWTFIILFILQESKLKTKTSPLEQIGNRLVAFTTKKKEFIAFIFSVRFPPISIWLGNNLFGNTLGFSLRSGIEFNGWHSAPFNIVFVWMEFRGILSSNPTSIESNAYFLRFFCAQHSFRFFHLLHKHKPSSWNFTIFFSPSHCHLWVRTLQTTINFQ